MDPNHVIRWIPVALMVGAGLLLSGCRIERKSEAAQKASTSVAGSFENKSFNPKADVDAMWDAKVLPAIDKMAVDYPALKAAMQQNLDQAGAAHGFREKGEGSPWNMAVRVTGKVVAVESELSAGTADIDVDNDGKADVQIQIGPVIRATAIRDTLPFISFTNYTNQIDFAQLANALNDRAYAATLKDVDRAGLLGKTVALTGVFPADNGDEPPLVTVLAFKVTGP